MHTWEYQGPDLSLHPCGFISMRFRFLSPRCLGLGGLVGRGSNLLCAPPSLRPPSPLLVTEVYLHTHTGKVTEVYFSLAHVHMGWLGGLRASTSAGLSAKGREREQDGCTKALPLELSSHWLPLASGRQGSAILSFAGEWNQNYLLSSTNEHPNNTPSVRRDPTFGPATGQLLSLCDQSPCFLISPLQLCSLLWQSPRAGRHLQWLLQLISPGREGILGGMPAPPSQ